MGRKAVADQDRRTPHAVRYSGREWAQVVERASTAGLGPTTYARLASLGVRPRAVPDANRVEWVRLARLSANVNQLALAANSGAAVQVNPALLEAVRDELRALRSALLAGETS